MNFAYKEGRDPFVCPARNELLKLLLRKMAFGAIVRLHQLNQHKTES